MSDSKILSIFVIVIAVFALYLHSQKKLKPVLSAITAVPDYGAKGMVSLGQFAVAFVVLLFILSMLGNRNATIFTVLIVMGALLVDNKTMGNNDTLHTLFGRD